ncbi:MAG: hypothetical protein ABJN69_02565 [Hellea sp.]
MRLAVFTLSAVLLSGCSWLGGMGGGFNSGGQGHHAQKAGHYNQGGRYNARAQHGQHQYRAQQDPCQIYSPQAPIPQGCNPAQVTLGTAGGFPQQPNFGGGQYASQGYGSHAGVAGQQAAHYQPRKQMRKPRLRGSLSLGVEKSLSGDLLDYSRVPTLNPELAYDPDDYAEGIFREGSALGGRIVDTTYTAIVEEISKPNISFDDVHSTPLSLKGGFEYIMTPKTTVFANAGYAHSEGNSGQVIGITGELQKYVRTRTYQILPAVPGTPAVPATFNPDGSVLTPASPAVPGTPETPVLAADFTTLGVIPNENIANYSYDFSDQRRIDLEVGARHYFDPVVKSKGYKTLTPFVGASVGVTHHNAVSFDITQDQRFYQRGYEDGADDYYQVVPANVTGSTNVDLYDSQWVPSGQLNAGMEWQVTPKTALAFETGVRIEGARKYGNDEKGDKNIAIPMTIRGSYNF